MNPRTFLQNFEQSPHRDALVTKVANSMTEYCIDEAIRVDEISESEIEQLAEAFVKRGLNVPESEATKSAKNRYVSEEIQSLTDEQIEALKESHAIGSSDAKYVRTEDE